MSKEHYLYCLTFPNQKKYIGYTTNYTRRFNNHRSEASCGSQLPIHRAIRKHGFPSYQIICVGDRGFITALEIAAIAVFSTRNPKFGYNINLGGDISPATMPEVRAKISAMRMGIEFSPKHRANLRAALTGRKATEAHRQNISAALKGRKHPRSPEWTAKITAALTGRTLAPEHVAKIAATNKAAGRKLSPEHKAKFVAAGNAARPKTHTPETREKMSIAHRGNPAGGLASMAKLTPEERSARAKHAANSRWKPQCPTDVLPST